MVRYEDERPGCCALVRDTEHLVGWGRELNVSLSSMYQPHGKVEEQRWEVILIRSL